VVYAFKHYFVSTDNTNSVRYTMHSLVGD